MAEEFTLDEWMSTERESFTVDPEVVAQLKAIMDQFHKVAEEHKVPYVCHFVENSNPDMFGMVTGAVLTPTGRVPAELLACYTLGMFGMDDGISTIMHMISRGV